MKEDFGVKYNTEIYDIQNFLANHPGGINYVKPYREKDISKPMSQYEHSKAAYYLMKEYKTDGRDAKAEDDLEVGVISFYKNIQQEGGILN